MHGRGLLGVEDSVVVEVVHGGHLVLFLVCFGVVLNASEGREAWLKSREGLVVLAVFWMRVSGREG